MINDALAGKIHNDAEKAVLAAYALELTEHLVTAICKIADNLSERR